MLCDECCSVFEYEALTFSSWWIGVGWSIRSYELLPSLKWLFDCPATRLADDSWPPDGRRQVRLVTWPTTDQSQGWSEEWVRRIPPQPSLLRPFTAVPPSSLHSRPSSVPPPFLLRPFTAVPPPSLHSRPSFVPLQPSFLRPFTTVPPPSLLRPHRCSLLPWPAGPCRPLVLFVYLFICLFP